MTNKNDMTAEKYLREYLGDNMYVETLTPLAIAEFAEYYYKKRLDAVAKEIIKEDFEVDLPEELIIHVMPGDLRLVDSKGNTIDDSRLREVIRVRLRLKQTQGGTG